MPVLLTSAVQCSIVGAISLILMYQDLWKATAVFMMISVKRGFYQTSGSARMRNWRHRDLCDKCMTCANLNRAWHDRGPIDVAILQDSNSEGKTDEVHNKDNCFPYRGRGCKTDLRRRALYLLEIWTNTAPGTPEASLFFPHYWDVEPIWMVNIWSHGPCERLSLWLCE